MNKWLLIWLASGWLFSGSSFAEDPEQLIRDTANNVLNEIKANTAKFAEEPQKLYDLVDKVVLPHFDFSTMTNLALGRYKNEVNDDQRPLIENEFRVLLVKTYGKALLEYNDEKIAFLASEGSVASGEVTVRTEIQQAGGFPIPMNYRLKKGANGWKVYDISVDDISLVTNYRSSFARQIKKNGVDGLIETLKARNEGQ
ncbi:MAG: phospholipid transport system substrate-binding protein [Gammaproteobacteria bacterium]|jgi:phospholipid transport system substrate-binding protein